MAVLNVVVFLATSLVVGRVLLMKGLEHSTVGSVVGC